MSRAAESAATAEEQGEPRLESGLSKKRKRLERKDKSRSDEHSSRHKKRRRGKVNDNALEYSHPGETVTEPDASHVQTQGAGSINEPAAASPFFEQTVSFYLPISPIGQSHPLESICAEHLSPLLLTYYTPFKGIVLSYTNVRLSDSPDGDGTGIGTALARSVNEYAGVYLWVTADFTIFRPIRGSRIEGHITLQSKSHLGLVCWNLFNASIEQKRLPPPWRWINMSKGGHKIASTDSSRGNEMWAGREDILEGCWADAVGKKIGETVNFWVRDFDAAHGHGQEKGLVSIEGSLLDDVEEEKLADAERITATMHARDGHGHQRKKKKHSDRSEDRDRYTA